MNSCIISGSWQSITLVCGNHEDKTHIMKLQEGTTLCYTCPSHDKEGEEKCSNFITLTEYEKMLDYIANLLVDADTAGQVMDLTHYRWKTRSGIEYEILEQTKDGNYTIKVMNKKAFIKK